MHFVRFGCRLGHPLGLHLVTFGKFSKVCFWRQFWDSKKRANILRTCATAVAGPVDLSLADSGNKFYTPGVMPKAWGRESQGCTRVGGPALLAHWLAGWLADWLAGWPAAFLAGWLAGWHAGWHAGWLAGWLADWLTGRLLSG